MLTTKVDDSAGEVTMPLPQNETVQSNQSLQAMDQNAVDEHLLSISQSTSEKKKKKKYKKPSQQTTPEPERGGAKKPPQQTTTEGDECGGSAAGSSGSIEDVIEKALKEQFMKSIGEELGEAFQTELGIAFNVGGDRDRQDGTASVGSGGGTANVK